MSVGLLGVYLLKVSVLLILLFIFNKLLLGRETFHRFNRLLWLATLAFSFTLPLLPLFDFSVAQEVAQVGALEVVDLEMLDLEIVAADKPFVSLSTVVKSLFWIYLMGVLVLVVHNAISHISLCRLIFNSKYDIVCRNLPQDQELIATLGECEARIGVNGNVRYVVHDLAVSPFSWFNFVVVSRDDLRVNGHEIVMHELSHCQQFHSLDIVLANLATIILWFNPAAWLTKLSLQQVHEYCADESVLSAGVNAKEYQLLLIRKAVGSRLYSISNSLNHSNLKNRITMMLQKKSNKMAAAKCLYAIPLVALVMALFASPALADSTAAITEVKITNNFDINQGEFPENVYQGDELEEIAILRLGSSGSAISAKEGEKETDATLFVNGEQVSMNNLSTIDKNKIEKIEVVKGSHSYDNYQEGDRSAGAIMVTLKDGETLASATITKQQVQETKKDTPFLRCEQMPTFNGDGDLVVFRSWVVERLRYPAEAHSKGITGTVLVSFVVETDGSVSEVVCKQSPDPLLFEEAKRIVLLSSGMWTPGMQRGKNVRVAYMLPVIFSLGEDPNATES